MFSLKEPVGIVFSDELGGLSKESTESEGQGAGNSSVCFIASCVCRFPDSERVFRRDLHCCCCC